LIAEENIYNILVRVDANDVIGMAHVIRTAQLINQFNFKFHIFLLSNDEIVKKYIHCREFIKLKDNEMSSLSTVLSQVKPDLVIIDYPLMNKSLWEAYRNKSNVIAVDDYGGEVIADVIINGTVLNEYHLYPKIKESTKVFAGISYALIRTQFLSRTWKYNPDGHVTIVIGSGENAIKWVLFLCENIRNILNSIKINIVVNSNFSEINKLKENCNINKIDVYQDLNADELSKQFVNSQYVIITGGTLLYEAVAVGVPAIVYPQFKNLIKEVDWFEKKDAIINLEYSGAFDSIKLEKIIKKITNNKKYLSNMSNKQKILFPKTQFPMVLKEIKKLLNISK